MRILYDRLHADRHAPILTILLPGAMQRPEDLVQAGFIDAVRTRGLPMDLALVDLQLAYVGEAGDAAAVQRLHEGVVLPAHRRGVAQIWLGGISIGAFMALAYAGRYAGGVDGLCLLAPYPGSRLLTNEIAAAGGLERWAAADADDAAERRVWRWLQSCRAVGAQVYFGYGRQDRFACGQQRMAEALAGDCVDVVEGGHDWPAWQQLWDNFLDRIAPRLQHLHTDPAA